MIDFRPDAEVAALVDRVRAYVRDVVLPAEWELGNPIDLDAAWPAILELRAAARERGIYTPGLPPAWGGLGLGPIAMAFVAQECGASALAALGLNAMSPDEGNMHTLLVAGTADQQQRWLRPLAAGTIRSCFCMTEPDVASSDATNLQATAVREGDAWVLNGRKWFATGAKGAAFAIVVARTADESRPRHRQFSLFLVPCDAPGWTVRRDPGIIGAHAVGGHPEVHMQDVRVPADHLLGAEGDGFVVAQKRLGQGRLSHAMRWIAIAQRAVDLCAERLLDRESFGRRLADHQMLQTFLADSAIDLYTSRLVVLHAAWKVEHDLPHRQEISMVKTHVSEAYGRVLDRAVQMFGSHGIATDAPVAQWYADARAARIYDGTSEVHRMSIARNLLRLTEDGVSTGAACGALV